MKNRDIQRGNIVKVTTISASVRYSKPLGDGSHKTIELGAEAALTGQEAWTDAQASLYTELGQQLKTLWAAKANGQQVSTPEHHCQEHSVAFQRYEKEGRVWWAHKRGGKWCREKA